MNDHQTPQIVTHRSWPGDDQLDQITRGSRNPIEALAGAFLAGFSNDRTRDAYRYDLKRWFEFAESLGFQPLEAKRSMIDLYVRQMEMDGLAPATCNRRLTAMASFYQWLVDEDYLGKTPLKRVKRPKVPTDVPRAFLGRHQLADWLDAAEKIGGYDYAAACLLAHNGLRVSELAKANVEDLDRERHHTTLRIMGKGSKPDVIPLTARTKYALDAAHEIGGGGGGFGASCRRTAHPYRHRHPGDTGFGRPDGATSREEGRHPQGPHPALAQKVIDYRAARSRRSSGRSGVRQTPKTQHYAGVQHEETQPRPARRLHPRGLHRSGRRP